VKEPIEPEWPWMRKGQVVFTYFHFARVGAAHAGGDHVGHSSPSVREVQLPSGDLPLLTPMSEVAGRMAVQEGAKYLEKGVRRSGICSGECRRTAGGVLIIGGGVVGANAAKMAAGLAPGVTLLDLSLDRLRYLADVLPSNVDLLSPTATICSSSCAEPISVIGAVLLPGAKAPKLVRATT